MGKFESSKGAQGPQQVAERGGHGAFSMPVLQAMSDTGTRSTGVSVTAGAIGMGLAAQSASQDGLLAFAATLPDAELLASFAKYASEGARGEQPGVELQAAAAAEEPSALSATEAQSGPEQPQVEGSEAVVQDGSAAAGVPQSPPIANVATEASAAEARAVVGAMSPQGAPTSVAAGVQVDIVDRADGSAGGQQLAPIINIVPGDHSVPGGLLGEDGLVGPVIDLVVGDDGLVNGVLDGVLGENGVVGVLVGEDGLLSGVLGDGGLVDSVIGDGGVVDGLLGKEGLIGGVLGDGGLVGGLLGEEGLVGGALGDDGLIGGIADDLLEPVLGDGGVVGGLLGEEGLVGGVLGDGGLAGGLLGDDRLIGGVADDLLGPVLGDGGLLGGLLGGVGSDPEKDIPNDLPGGSEGLNEETLSGGPILGAVLGDEGLVGKAPVVGGLLGGLLGGQPAAVTDIARNVMPAPEAAADTSFDDMPVDDDGFLDTLVAGSAEELFGAADTLLDPGTSLFDGLLGDADIFGLNTVEDSPEGDDLFAGLAGEEGLTGSLVDEGVLGLSVPLEGYAPDPEVDNLLNDILAGGVGDITEETEAFDALLGNEAASEEGGALIGDGLGALTEVGAVENALGVLFGQDSSEGSSLLGGLFTGAADDDTV